MTILVDLNTIPLSATTISTAGTIRWMSPELLFGQNGPPTRESDRYALGMVIYEVSWLRSSQKPFIHQPPGSDRPPTVSSSRGLCGGDRCAGGVSPKETRRRRVLGILWPTVAVGANVLEWVALGSTNRPRAPSLSPRCLPHLGTPECPPISSPR